MQHRCGERERETEKKSKEQGQTDTPTTWAGLQDYRIRIIEHCPGFKGHDRLLIRAERARNAYHYQHCYHQPAPRCPVSRSNIPDRQVEPRSLQVDYEFDSVGLLVDLSAPTVHSGLF